jgi:hypothetical protein
MVLRNRHGVIFNFLERVGILWQTNRLRPVQEHVTTSISRQKIIHAIEWLPLPNGILPCLCFFYRRRTPRAGLLVCVLPVAQGRALRRFILALYVPFKDVEYVAEFKRPDYLYLHLTTFPQARFNRLVHLLQRPLMAEN